MSGVSRFDCYPSDFLNGIIGLTADQIAAYTVLMMLQYDRGVPVQYVGRERELSVRAGLPKGRLGKAVAALIEFKKLGLSDSGALFDPKCRSGTRLPFAEWMWVRSRVFERDGFVCLYCGSGDRPLECDHVVPVSRGGGHDFSNLATSCFDCNRSKGAKTLTEWQG
jgi:hypothetical protein